MATPIDVDRDSDATLSSDSDEEMKSTDGAHSPPIIHSSHRPGTSTDSAQPARTAALLSTTLQTPTASFSASMAAARGSLLSAAAMGNETRMSTVESPRPGSASVSMANGKKRRLRSPPPPARGASELGKPRASLDFRLPSNVKRVDQRVRLIDDDEDLDEEETTSDPGEKRTTVETTNTHRREAVALYRTPSSSSSSSSVMSSTMNRVESMRTWVCGQWFGKCVLEFHAVYVRIELLTLPSLGETADCAFRGSIQNRQLERFCLSRGSAPYFAILEFARRAEFEPAFAEFYDAIFARVTEREGPSVEPDIYGVVLFFDDDLELARCQSLGDSTKTLRALLEKTIPADEATQVRALKFDPSRASSTTAPRSSTSILAKLTGSVKGTIDMISHLFSADRSPPKLRQTKITRMDATEASSDHESNAMSTQFRTSSRRKSLLQQSARDAEVVVQLSGGETDTALNHASDDNGRSDRRSTRGTAQLLQHQRQETKRLAAERKAKLLLSYPFEESSRVGQITITYGDIDRLKPGEFLNDSIIDFYLRYLWRHVEPWQQDLVYFFSSHFFTQLCGEKLSGSVSLSEDRLRRVARWTQKEDLFKKRFIFVPINDSCHWSIAVLCNPGSAIVQKRRRPSARKTGRSMDDSVILVDANDDPVIVDTTEDASDSEEEEQLQKERLKNPPCLLFLDSLRCHQKKKICTLLKSYIEFEFNARFSATQASEAASTSESATVTSFDLEAMTIIEPEIPLQSNSSDCGVFLLMYTAQILQRFPAGLCHDDVRSQLTSSMSKQMFDDGHVQEFRDYLHQLIFMLSKIERRGGSEMAIKTEGLEFFAVEN